jgi:hypothetical protein
MTQRHLEFLHLGVSRGARFCRGRKLLFRAQADHACYRVGDVAQRLFLRLALRDATGKFQALGNPSTVKGIGSDPHCESPCRVVVSPFGLEAAHDAPYG